MTLFLVSRQRATYESITSFGVTLDMGGWLDLSQQGLSPCQKY